LSHELKEVKPIAFFCAEFKYIVSFLYQAWFLSEAQLNLNKAFINPLKTKLRPLYLKTQSVTHSKHFSSRL